MKYIVGLSGTHGTGKSTILKGVKTLGCFISEAQLARSAQKALGWDTLKRAQESVENMWALQEAVLTAMNTRDADLTTSHSVTLVERSPADMWAYTKMWCGRLGINPETDSHAKDYKSQCVELASRYSAIIIVPMSDAVPFVEEPNRADLASRVPVAETINEFLSYEGAPRTYLIRGVTPAERILESSLIIQLESRHGNRI